jgi:uncharacterized tellurite resistance protein B-like protein|uniref:TerB family tellurite resistance protein n=1 Tax=Prevotella sp. TaxID=59823 RepID=UPI002626F7DC
MKYTGIELSAIVKLANAMVMADGKVANEEIAAMSIELAKFGVDENAAKSIIGAADAMEYGHAVAVVAAMNLEQKKYVTGYLAFIMAADGEIAATEVSMWQLLSTLAQLPTMTVAEALLFWNNH